MVGVIGISPTTFWDLTPLETGHIQDAFYRDKLIESRERWELARYNAYFGLLPHQGKNKRLRITDLGIFGWEQLSKEVGQPLTKEEINKFNKWGKIEKVDQFILEKKEQVKAFNLLWQKAN